MPETLKLELPLGDAIGEGASTLKVLINPDPQEDPMSITSQFGVYNIVWYIMLYM